MLFDKFTSTQLFCASLVCGAMGAISSVVVWREIKASGSVGDLALHGVIGSACLIIAG